MSSSIRATIQNLVEQGLGNREILKKVNALRRSQGKSTTTYNEVCKIVDEIEVDTATEKIVANILAQMSDGVPAPRGVTVTMTINELSDSDDSDDDSEYVPEDDDDDSSDDEDDDFLVPEDDSDDDSEDSSDSEESEDVDDPLLRKSARIYFNHDHGEYYDEITIRPIEDGTFHVVFEYDKKSKKDMSTAYTAFEGSADAVEEYIRHILQVTAIDDKPYKEIEFDVPFYPAISTVPASLLKKTKRSIIAKMFREYLASF
jgi:hypothetical protein